MDNKTNNNYSSDSQEEICLHESCPECHGTGIKSDGSMCMHHIACPCPKCTPRC